MVVTILMVLFVCIETELAENIWLVMVGMGGRKQGGEETMRFDKLMCI